MLHFPQVSVRCTLCPPQIPGNPQHFQKRYQYDQIRTGKKDKLVSHLIYQRQSPYQIVTNHPERDMSVRSVYTYIKKGLFTARNINLKRKTKFRPRKCRKTQITDREVFCSRMYSDFLLLARNMGRQPLKWTPIFISCSIPSLQTGERNSATQVRWRPAYTEKNAPVSSTVTLCAVGKKAVLKMHTPCSGWSFQKAPVSISVSAK